MKIYKAITIAFAAILLTVSCGVLGRQGSKAAKGKSVGESLLAIYTQYKTDGRIDLTNLNNIINIANIAGKLKGHSFDATDNAEFVNGLISGADNLINSSNANSVVGLLDKISKLDLSALTNVAKSAEKNAAAVAGDAANAAAAELASSSEVASAVSALTGILNLMRK